MAQTQTAKAPPSRRIVLTHDGSQHCTAEPQLRIGAIDVKVTMPGGLSPTDRQRLGAAAEHCPIEHGFAGDAPVTVGYRDPD